MSRVERAVDLFSKGANCAQSVLWAFAEDMGMDKETALRVATGFGGGMGRMAGVCGAVTGGCMALGLSKGMRATEDQDAKLKTYALVRELAARFTAKNSSTICRDILGVDIGTEAGHQAAQDKNLFNTRCVDCVKDAVRIVERLI